MAGKKPAPKTAEQLRKEAKQRLKQRSVEQYLPLNKEERIVALEEITQMDFTTFNKRELLQLQGIFQTIYNSAVEELQAEKELQAEQCVISKARAGLEEALEQGVTSSAKSMTTEEWNELHGLRENGKRKPGPQKKPPRSLFDLAPGSKGTITKEEHEERGRDSKPMP